MDVDGDAGGHHRNNNNNNNTSKDSSSDGKGSNKQRPRSPQVMQPKKRARKVMENSCNCEELRYVQCVLETKDLWDKFHDLETEMIITKTGR